MPLRIKSFRTAVILLALPALLTGVTAGCRGLPAAPPQLTTGDYSPVTIQQLQDPRRTGLREGQKVRVEGYFWQYLDYDPFMTARYLAIARHPAYQVRRRWASLYGTPQLEGYYDRLVLNRQLRQELDLRRLKHVRIYGQMASLPFGILYLEAHHIAPLEAENHPSHQEPAPAASGREMPER